MNTIHYSMDRKEREYFINEVIGLGNIVDEFIVDKHHPNGLEIHQITDTGIIIVLNKRTRKVCTKLIARPGQIRRYYNGNAPKNLIKIAREHQEKGYNLL